MQLTTVAVVGAGGLVGSTITKKLREDGGFVLTALVRPSSKYTPPEGVRRVTADFEDDKSLFEALLGHDALVCCLPGIAPFANQKLLIDAAIAAGVQLYVSSEFIGPMYGKDQQLNGEVVFGEKPRVREYLEKVAAEDKICWTALNGGGKEIWLKEGFAGFNLVEHKAKIYDSGNAVFCWTPIPMLATGVVNMLKSPDWIVNRSVFVCGILNLSQNQLLAALEQETGTKFAVEHLEVGPKYKVAKAAYEDGRFDEDVRQDLAMNILFSDKNSSADFWDRVENEVVGIEPVTVAQAAKDMVRALNDNLWLGFMGLYD